MDQFLSQFSIYIVFAVVAILIGLIHRIKGEIKKIVERLDTYDEVEIFLDDLVELPEPLESYMDKAVHLGINMAEQLDVSGQLENLWTDLESKSEIKLQEAVRAASKYLETVAKNYGVEIDIPEQTITDMIEAALFDRKQDISKG